MQDNHDKGGVMALEAAADRPLEVTFDLTGVQTKRGLFVSVDQLIALLYKSGLADMAVAMEQWKRDWNGG